VADLISAADLKAEIGVSGSAKDSQITGICGRVTQLVEDYCHRVFVTAGDITEYHSLALPAPDLYVSQWPIITITSVAESAVWPRDYGSALVAETDYHALKPEGRIIRWNTGGRGYWQTGHRTVKVVYSAGYATAAAVPKAVADVALRLGALLWREIDKQMQGISSASDALGNVTRFTHARLTPEMKEALNPYRRVELNGTWEIDS
jgi:hypothetical protein